MGHLICDPNSYLNFGKVKIELATRILEMTNKNSMLLILGCINNREILYSNVGVHLQEVDSFPENNWLLFVIVDKPQQNMLHAFAEKCLDKNVLYVCGVGEACSEIDDAFDEADLIRRSDNFRIELSHSDFDDAAMTTWHHNFDEGFWFATTTAYHDNATISKVVIANLTLDDKSDSIRLLIEKINLGWLPPDETS